MNGGSIGKMIGYAAYAAFLLIGCHANTGVNPDNPTFGNLTRLGDDRTYVAYPFPDPWKRKLDTLTLSFEYNPSKVKSISVKATIDSGKTWLPITTLSPDGSNSHTVHWIPKNAPTVPKYFGIKRCFIRIADTTSNDFIDSDTFPLVGAASIVLLDSLEHGIFHVTDTIKVQYGANMDLSSNIQTYFKTDSMNRWVEFVNDSKLPSPDAPLIQNRQKCLIPAAADSMVKFEAENFTQPIKILLKDYSVADCTLMTGDIAILP